MNADEIKHSAILESQKEFGECLKWLQNRMDEYTDKEACQHDYKMANIAWQFMRARTLIGRSRDVGEHNLPELLRIIAYPSVYRKDLEAAADLIESLEAQLAEWKERHNQAAINFQQENRECAKLQGENEELRKANEEYQNAQHELFMALCESQRRAQDARNELCLKCGRYREAHKGACDGCRRKENEHGN